MTIGVAQVDALAAAVGEPAFVERLQEQVEQVRARLLDFVEQHDACTGCPSAGWSARRRARCRRCRAACRSACRPTTEPSWYSDMSTRTIFFSSPNRNSATAFASSVLPTPVGPRNSSTPSGRSKPSLSGPLFSTSRRATALTRLLLPDDALLQRALDVLEAIGDVAEDHVLGNLRRVRDDRDDVVALRPPSARSISARTAAVSSQPMTLSGRCRCRM